MVRMFTVKRVEKLTDFLWIFTLAFGVIVGIGFMFIGFISYRFIITLLGVISTILGLIAIPFLKNDKEYI